MKTYILKKRKDRKSIRGWCGSLKAQSPTYYGKAMAGLASARGAALCKHNHLHSVGRQWQDQHQQGVCTLQAQSLTGCGKAMAGSTSARGSPIRSEEHTSELQSLRH